MKTAFRLVDHIKLGLSIALLAGATGCVGYVDGGYRGAVVVPGPPDVYFYGGGYEHRHEVRGYSERGYQSRGSVHVSPPRLPAPPHPPGLPRLPGLP